MALVADYGMSSDESDEEESPSTSAANVTPSVSSLTQSDEVLEDFVKKTNYGGAVIEKPPPKVAASDSLSKMRLKKSAQGKIQISIPTFQDSDSDDDEPKRKKEKVSSGAAGFLGSLPAPRGIMGNRESGQPFIPYTLTKAKPADKPKSIPKPKKSSTAARSTTNSDSDDDLTHAGQSATNFFSLTPEPSHSKLTGDANTTPSMSGTTATYAGVEETKPRMTAASFYNMSEESEQTSYGIEYPDQHMPEPKQNDMDDLLQNEEFLKLQGKKHRGKEAIDIIDIHSDDQKVSELELTKNISQEVDPAAYAHRKRGGHSGQSKRKHQITYLAYQAKERELELKNQWAANNVAKQQSRAKYGF